MNLIITFDYELFGDGTGNVFTHIIEPTNTILGLCQKHGIKTTIFFEVLEYLKLKEEWESGNTMGYYENPVNAIEQQIQQAAKDGHDIQLHIHPQWHNAKYVNGQWNLNLNNWRLGDFKGENNYGIKELISDCKTALEALIQPVKPNYKCIALRAGGYNIMPSAKIYKAMQQVGLKIDSSVYPGGYETGSLSQYDYRNIPLNLDYWWANEKDIRDASNTKKDILEISIFALQVPRWKQVLTLSKIKSLLFRQKTAMSAVAKEKISNKSLWQKIQFMLEKEASTWDVCMFSKSLHKKFFGYIENNLANQRNSFVLIGHPKSLQNKKLFEDFITTAKERNTNYQFKTLTEYYNTIKKNTDNTDATDKHR